MLPDRRRSRAILALALLAALTFAARALAAAGALDKSFSGDGRVTTAFPDQGGLGSQGGGGLAIQGDGKIIVSGTSFQGSPMLRPEFALARYRPGGSRDLGFGTNGRVLTTFPTSAGSPADYGGQVAVQKDGKIVVVGASKQGSGNQFAIVRYSKGGGLDHTFSGDGRKLTRFPDSVGNDGANAVAIQGDGKIVVAGDSEQATGEQFAVARYLPNGRLDHTFSGDGRKLTHFRDSTGDVASDLAIGRDGRIVAGGDSTHGGLHQFAVARYKPNGSLDHGFSGDGRRVLDFPGVTGTFGDLGQAVALQRNDAVLIAGSSDQASGGLPAIARLRPDGSLDPSFSGDGRRLVHFPQTTDGRFEDIAIQSNARIVAGAYVKDSNSVFDMAFARFHTDGSLDPSFSGDGRRLIGFFGNDTTLYHLAIQRDGKIVGAGSMLPRTGPGSFQFAVARVLGS